jgi:hypothetical protein
MTMTPSEAAARLAEIADATIKTRTAVSYGYASPLLILWGVIWMIGYGSGYVVSRAFSAMIWPWISLVGVAISVAYGMTAAKQCMNPQPLLARWGWLPILGFGLIWANLLGIRSHEQAGAFFATLAMFGYVLLGMHRGRFFLWVGLSVTALTLLTYIYAGLYFDPIMGALGGGALIAGGVHLSKWR